MSAGEVPEFRDVFAPEVPAGTRRQLASAGAGGAYPVALAWVVAVLFGVAGAAVLVSGAAPRGASPVLFDAVVGGGGLAVAVAAALMALRGSAGLRRYRAARRAGLLVERRELVALADRDPALGALVWRAQRAVDRVRSGVGYAGGMSTVLDEATLDRIEWTVVTAALGADAGTAERLTGEVGRLERLAETAESRQVTAEPPSTGAVAELTDELDRATTVAAELERLRRRDT